ncbi:unnamed protein product [Triticum turgidum subsp. durum]|uniref:AAA+ ATPase domain-containing protein n=2 Tax=Triticum turgidum subsp. durum TaxID=4567 RepID=A0A9R0W4Z4_TRITD|nr:unnamed protein product [Triticum turgidum subsp. durum]
MAPMDKWVGVGTAMTVFTLLCSRMPDRIHGEARHFITKWAPIIAAYFNPYIQLSISEQSDEQFRRNELFDHISAYLTDACARDARKLKMALGKDGKIPEITLDDNVKVTDDYEGARIWWYASNKGPSYRSRGPVFNLFPTESEPRVFRAVFHKRHRDVVLTKYMPFALDKGHGIIANRGRKRRLYTNHRPGNKSTWSHVPFEHPATFDKLAMDPVQKEELINDLDEFTGGKKYYSDVGKAWKRGYLLYGPPGTGKSTLVSAMANKLNYDVYDLDLTSIKSNAELRKLFLETKGKSIIMIEDIDAIEVDLARSRKKRASSSSSSDLLSAELDPSKDDGSKVTLSGLLSFVDGLWSASGSERIIVFTTNHVDTLDPALIRRGRMDMHIRMSYCRFGAFKVLANNYLQVNDHELFGEIQRLLHHTDISPADVAHTLMRKCNKRKRDTDEVIAAKCNKTKTDTDTCLAGLVETLKKKAKKRESTTTAPANEDTAPAFHEGSAIEI